MMGVVQVPVGVPTPEPAHVAFVSENCALHEVVVVVEGEKVVVEGEGEKVVGRAEEEARAVEEGVEAVVEE